MATPAQPLRPKLYSMGYPHDRAFRQPPMPVRGPPRTYHPPPPKHLTPFDPEELTRRLYLVQAEQKVHADRKRRGKGETERQGKTANVGETRISRNSNRTRLPLPPDAKRARGKENDPDARTSQDSPRIKRESSPHSQQCPRRAGSIASTGSCGKVKENDEAPSTYHHVPQVAASQFSRTTTVGSPEDTHIHSLSKKALKFHLDGPNADQNLVAMDDHVAPRDAARNLKRVQSQREKHYERNQFQHPSTLDSAIEIDDERLRLGQSHTFDTSYGRDEKDHDIENALKRASTGGNFFAPIFSELPANALHLDRLDNRDNGFTGDSRVDWTQSDERHKSPGHVAPSLLRKVDSKWNLKGRFAKSQKQSKPHTLSSPVEETATEESPVSPKSPKPGFFSRFKR